MRTRIIFPLTIVAGCVLAISTSRLTAGDAPAAPAAAEPAAVQELPVPPGARPILMGGLAGGGRGLTAAPVPAGMRAGNPVAFAPAQAQPLANTGANYYWTLAILSDPNDLKVYRDKNAQLGPPKPGEDRVIFLGDSITENWGRALAQYFPNRPNYIGRGYTSETTQNMLIRFRPDVINLQPKAVVILAGVNDIAGNTGEVPDATIHDNFISMFDLAKANNIKVVLVSTLPATTFFWQPSLKPQARIKALVAWEKEYAGKNGLYFVDAYPEMKDENDGMRAGLASDSVHPSQAGYQIVSRLTEVQIQKALRGEPPAQ